MPCATAVQRPGFFDSSVLNDLRMTPHSSGSLSGLNAGTLPAFSYSYALCTNSVASPPSSTMRFGPLPSGHTRHSTVHHQYSSSVSPFHAKTGMPFGFCTVPPVSGRPTTTAAAAWSCVEKMLHDTQRTSAPSSDSVSMSTPVWIVIWRLPMMRAPASGFFPSYRLRTAIRPGISPSANLSSFRPNSARPRSATLNGTRPACFACSYACTLPLTAVAIAFSLSLFEFLLLDCHCREQCRSLCIGIHRQHPHANLLEPCASQQARNLAL